MEKRKRGVIFYEGASMIDGGHDIVGIAAGFHAGRAANRKTGAMVQTYCGECVHRAHRTCYVRVEAGPNRVWNAYRAGRYDKISLEEARRLLAGQLVRLGAYGDPAAIPFPVWDDILATASGWTGYTHQWKHEQAAPFKRFAMASCDTMDEYREARATGWRAFYVVPKGTAKVPGAFLCPASEEGGRKLTCSECLSCSGTSGKATASVFIPVHGLAYKQVRFSNLIQISKISA